jgi:hypothetical protein
MSSRPLMLRSSQSGMTAITSHSSTNFPLRDLSSLDILRMLIGPHFFPVTGP